MGLLQWSAVLHTVKYRRVEFSYTPPHFKSKDTGEKLNWKDRIKPSLTCSELPNEVKYV